MCLSLLMLLLQENWNRLFVKAEHRMSANLISVTWFTEGMVWLTVMVISYLIGFRRPLKDLQTNKKFNPVQVFNEFFRNLISCNYQCYFHNWRNTGLGATTWKISVCIWTFRRLCPDHTTALDSHGGFFVISQDAATACCFSFQLRNVVRGLACPAEL